MGYGAHNPTPGKQRIEAAVDPNEALKQIRTLIARLKDARVEPDYRDAAQLANRVEALDQWLSRGGYLPREWGAAYQTRRV